MNKRVLVTGASRGIGSAIVESLQGFNLDIVTPNSTELDLANSDSVSQFLQKSEPFDLLVNNAGINIIKSIEDITPPDFERLNKINLTSPLQIMQHSIPSMKEKGFGRIVNISSIWGVRSKEKRALYSGSKFGLIGYTKALARELGEYNILVNAVCPGFVNTELTSASLTEQEKSSLISEVPLNRMANPSEIGDFVRYLLLENSYISGQALVIDGGYTA